MFGSLFKRSTVLELCLLLASPKTLLLQEAVDDCKEAIKLKQDSLKTIIVAVKALRCMKDFQKALDMLEIAEQIPEVDMRLVDKYRRETTREMKEHLLKI